jgi:hypothetical protein
VPDVAHHRDHPHDGRHGDGYLGGVAHQEVPPEPGEADDQALEEGPSLLGEGVHRCTPTLGRGSAARTRTTRAVASAYSTTSPTSMTSLPGQRTLSPSPVQNVP